MGYALNSAQRVFSSTGIYLHWANVSAGWQTQWPHKDHRSWVWNLIYHPHFLLLPQTSSQQSGALLPWCWACPTQLPTPDNTAEEPRGSCTRCFCQHSFPHRPSPVSFVTVNWHQSCWIMIRESQKCYLCCRNKAPSLSLFPACVKMESLIFVLASPAVALWVKQAEFSLFGLG